MRGDGMRGSRDEGNEGRREVRMHVDIHLHTHVHLCIPMQSCNSMCSKTTAASIQCNTYIIEYVWCCSKVMYMYILPGLHYEWSCGWPRNEAAHEWNVNNIK